MELYEDTINEYGINLKGYIKVTEILKPKSTFISELLINVGDVLEFTYKIECTRFYDLSAPTVTIKNLSNNLEKEVYVNKFISQHLGGFWNEDKKRTFRYKVVENDSRNW